MSALTRFWRMGMQDADRRVGAWLQRPSLDGADAYLKSSALITAIDRWILRWSAWWEASQSRKWFDEARASLAGISTSERYRTIGAIALVAALTHVGLTLANGSRPGWFWMVIPGMALAFAVPLLATSEEHPH